MIEIKRSAVAPSFSTLPIFKKMKQDLKKHYAKTQQHRRQQKPPYIPLPLSVLEKIRTYLHREFNGKCAYCESLITVTNQGDFDHFRPKSSARGMEEEFSLDHYWTLAFDWRNMYLSCEICNRYKLNWFPVEGKRALLSQTFLQILKNEKPLLLDPCNEDPGKHLGYAETGEVFSITEKGKITIDILKLNRKDLVENRLEKYQELNGVIAPLVHKIVKKDKKPLTLSQKGAINSLIEWINDISKNKTTRDYIGIQRYFLKTTFLGNTELTGFLIDNDSTGIFKKYLIKNRILHKSGTKNKPPMEYLTELKTARSTLKRFSIASIEIENFKSIEKIIIKFPESQNRKEPWLMLLGENGVGKSSFLQAIALTLMGETYRKKLDIKPVEILKSGTSKGFVKINQVDQAPIELHFTKSIIYNNIKSSPAYLLAYGSTRLFPSKKIKPEYTTGQIRAKNMFSADTALFADNWLISLKEKNKKQFDFAARALKSLLAKEFEDPEIMFVIKDKEVWIHYSDKAKMPDRLRSLSDGYKSIIALACDMMQALMQGNSTMEVAEGIVLLDEIGTHLHPRWKMRVVNSFRSAFPKLQFIVTTHDPLCLKGLFEGEIAVFDKTEEGQVYVIGDLPNPGEFRAEQLLSSRFFGLNSTIDEELEKDFDEYYSLIGRKDKLTDKEKERLADLTTMLRNKQHLGHSLREELAYNAVDHLLAKEKLAEQKTPIEELKKQTINILQELWDKTTEDQEKFIKQ